MKSKIESESMDALNNAEKASFDLTNWEVNGHIATHKSGITATATASATDSAKIACTLELSTQHNFDEEIDVGQLTAEALLLVIEGELTEAPKKPPSVVYEIPKEIRSQYHGYGEAFAVVKANKLRKIIYFRDVMPKEICNAFSKRDFSGFAGWSQSAQARSIFQANSLLGELKFGYCKDYQFVDIFPPEVRAELRDRRNF